MNSVEFIYVIHSVSVCKIGKTTDYEKRVKGLQGSSPEALALLRVYKVSDCTTVESELHKMFNHKRSHGEWFHLTTNDLDNIDGVMKLKKAERIIDPRWPVLKMQNGNDIVVHEKKITPEQYMSLRNVHIHIKRLQHEMSKLEHEVIRLSSYE